MGLPLETSKQEDGYEIEAATQDKRRPTHCEPNVHMHRT